MASTTACNADEHLIVGQSSTQLTHTLFMRYMPPPGGLYISYGPLVQ